MALSHIPTAQPQGITRRRASVACKRCRRQRSRCVHNNGVGPCESCREAGIDRAGCIFPMRGDPDEDRQFRHPRQRAQNLPRRGGGVARPRREAIESPPLTLRPLSDDQDEIKDLLPPFPEIRDAVHYLIGHEFQLSFIPKAHLLLSLRGGRHYDAFLLLSILSLSARYTPSLAQRHGSPNAATMVYLAHAQRVAQDAIWGGPSLDKCQAFYFLSKAQLYSGNKCGARQSLGIAMRMALQMRLHEEETYRLTNPIKDLAIKRESARRTFWMIYSQESLLSGPSLPGSLDPKYITVLLPSSEYDFAEGLEPSSRGALEDTAAAGKQSVHDPRRSLFATLLQATQLWVTISRWSLAEEGHSPSWGLESGHIRLAQKVHHWERTLNPEHSWSPALLRKYQKEGRDIAYTAIVMFTRICNILVRRPYLKKLMNPSPNTPEDWSQITKLFENTRELCELVDLQFSNRSCDGAGFMSDLSAFSVYTCGIMSVYLSNIPEVCPEPAIAREGPSMVRRTLAILEACQSIWPLARRWHEELSRFANGEKKAVAHSRASSISSGGCQEHASTQALPSLPPIAPAVPILRHPQPLPGFNIMIRLDPFMPQPSSSSSLGLASPRARPILPALSGYQPQPPQQLTALPPTPRASFSTESASVPAPCSPSSSSTGSAGAGALAHRSRHFASSPLPSPSPSCAEPAAAAAGMAAYQQHQPQLPSSFTLLPAPRSLLTLVNNDGFEHELQFFVNHGAPPPMTSSFWGEPASGY